MTTPSGRFDHYAGNLVDVAELLALLGVKREYVEWTTELEEAFDDAAYGVRNPIFEPTRNFGGRPYFSVRKAELLGCSVARIRRAPTRARSQVRRGIAKALGVSERYLQNFEKNLLSGKIKFERPLEAFEAEYEYFDDKGQTAAVEVYLVGLSKLEPDSE
jgi:hypothetical protein